MAPVQERIKVKAPSEKKGEKFHNSGGDYSKKLKQYLI